MSTIVLSGDTSGTITLDAPAVAGTNTLMLPALTGTLLTDKSVGSTLQVITASKSDTFSSTARTFADITGLSLSITPKFTTSKILVFMSVQVASDGIDAPMVQIVRNSTPIGIGDARGSRTRNTTQGIFQINSVSSLTGITLDSPNTTSATTYKLQIRIDSSTAFVNTQSATADGTFHGTCYSTILAMEIAG